MLRLTLLSLAAAMLRGARIGRDRFRGAGACSGAVVSFEMSRLATAATSAPLLVFIVHLIDSEEFDFGCVVGGSTSGNVSGGDRLEHDDVG